MTWRWNIASRPTTHHGLLKIRNEHVNWSWLRMSNSHQIFKTHKLPVHSLMAVIHTLTLIHSIAAPVLHYRYITLHYIIFPTSPKVLAPPDIVLVTRDLWMVRGRVCGWVDERREERRGEASSTYHRIKPHRIQSEHSHQSNLNLNPNLHPYASKSRSRLDYAMWVSERASKS